MALQRQAPFPTWAIPTPPPRLENAVEPALARTQGTVYGRQFPRAKDDLVTCDKAVTLHTSVETYFI